MISMFTATARGLRRTLDSMATPCSVKAYGRWRRPPRPLIGACRVRLATSSMVSLNTKSAGNRSRFRRTASFRRFGETPYKVASVVSSRTRSPRNQTMDSRTWEPSRATGALLACAVAGSGAPASPGGLMPGESAVQARRYVASSLEPFGSGRSASPKPRCERGTSASACPQRSCLRSQSATSNVCAQPAAILALP